MTRTVLLATVGAWALGAAAVWAQSPADPLPEIAPPPRPAGTRSVPTPPPGQMTNGAGLTPWSMAAPVGAIPDVKQSGHCQGCYNHNPWKFFTYCPIVGGCGKGCSCCCPQLYTFFLYTPLPTTRINAPLYIARYRASPVPLPTKTPLTPEQ